KDPEIHFERSIDRYRSAVAFASRQSRPWFGDLKRRWPFVIFILLLVTALAVHIDWTWKRKLSPRGGR
ncbi:MAG: hypothetical protein DME46_12300, partial [Verrucomicrobia bacterium]